MTHPKWAQTEKKGPFLGNFVSKLGSRTSQMGPIATEKDPKRRGHSGFWMRQTSQGQPGTLHVFVSPPLFSSSLSLLFSFLAPPLSLSFCFSSSHSSLLSFSVPLLLLISSSAPLLLAFSLSLGRSSASPLLSSARAPLFLSLLASPSSPPALLLPSLSFLGFSSSHSLGLSSSSTSAAVCVFFFCCELDIVWLIVFALPTQFP